MRFQCFAVEFSCYADGFDCVGIAEPLVFTTFVNLVTSLSLVLFAHVRCIIVLSLRLCCSVFALC